MRRIFAVLAITVLGIAILTNSAKAADCADLDLGPLLSVTADCQVLDTLGNVVGQVTGGVVEIVREIPVPGPTITVTAPPPAPATVTRTITPPTVTRPGPTQTQIAPTTVTQTAPPTTVPPATITATITRSGQAASTSGTVSPTPTLAAPPSGGGGLNLLPDEPAAAAATGGIFGLIIGLICAFLLMFIAYRRGHAAGEEKSLRDFLGYLRGTPEPGRHRL